MEDKTSDIDDYKELANETDSICVREFSYEADEEYFNKIKMPNPQQLEKMANTDYLQHTLKSIKKMIDQEDKDKNTFSSEYIKGLNKSYNSISSFVNDVSRAKALADIAAIRDDKSHAYHYPDQIEHTNARLKVKSLYEIAYPKQSNVKHKSFISIIIQSIKLTYYKYIKGYKNNDK